MARHAEPDDYDDDNASGDEFEEWTRTHGEWVRSIVIWAGVAGGVAFVVGVLIRGIAQGVRKSLFPHLVRIPATVPELLAVVVGGLVGALVGYLLRPRLRSRTDESPFIPTRGGRVWAGPDRVPAGGTTGSDVATAGLRDNTTAAAPRAAATNER